LEVLFRRAGYEVSLASDGRRGIEAARAAAVPFDLVVTDLVMPGADGIEVLRAAKERAADTQVIVITAHATIDTALAAMRAGAHDYVQKPYALEELRVRAERALEKRRLIGENAQLRARVAGRHSFGEIVAMSDRMAAVIGVCRRAAQIPTNVLITGESGTGKELAARAIHHEGTRAGKPFVVVDCGAIPETLIESELFGHVRGAFTGANVAAPGLFRSADGGTVFLDEIAELPLAMQVKLLRVLQERVVKPVGSVEEIAVDVRVIAATNRDLEAEVRAGRFREDLFYRLNVLRVEMPPLRERLADIKPLAEFFLRRYGGQLGRGAKAF
jgi:two-component system response regulator PilR (NtrC family)